MKPFVYLRLIEEDPTDVAGSIDLYLENLIGMPLAELNEWSMQTLPSYVAGRNGFQASQEAVECVRELIQFQLNQAEMHTAMHMLSERSRWVFQLGMGAVEKEDDVSRGVAARCFFIHEAVDRLMRIFGECRSVERA